MKWCACVTESVLDLSEDEIAEFVERCVLTNANTVYVVNEILRWSQKSETVRDLTINMRQEIYVTVLNRENQQGYRLFISGQDNDVPEWFLHRTHALIHYYESWEVDYILSLKNRQTLIDKMLLWDL